MSRTFTYSLDDNVSTLTVTTADVLTSIQGSSEDYQGYAVQSVTGTFQGRTVTGLLGAAATVGVSPLFGAYDNAIVPYGQPAPAGERYGIDGDGVAFSVAQTDPAQQTVYKLMILGDTAGVAVTPDGQQPSSMNVEVSNATGDPGGMEVFYVDGSQGAQELTGYADTNIVVTTQTAGTGDVVVDLGSGTVTRGGQVDANVSNIQGEVAGAQTTTVRENAEVSSSVPYIVYGGSGHLEYDASFLRTSAVISGSTSSSYIVGSDDGAQGAGTILFYGHGSTDVMIAGTNTNNMVCNPDPTSTSLFGGLKDTFSYDASSVETDYIYGQGGTVTDFGGTATQILYGGSGTNTLVGNTTPFTESPYSVVDKGTNVFYGGTGPNAGTDVFYAGIGVNIMYEGAGYDTFVGNAGTDHIVGGSGQSAIYGGSGDEYIDTGAGNQYLKAGTGTTVFNETAANLTAGRGDWIDGFKGASGAGQSGTYINLPQAAEAGTTFQSQNGGTLILTPATSGSGEAGLFVSNAPVAQVQAQTFFV